jgi:hypothetical protein
MTDDVLSEAREAFDLSAEVENDNRLAYIDDVRFARLEEQWPENVLKQRNLEGRPCLTINKLPPLIRQVVNDARQNKPAITCHPADSEADPETALILDGLIRQIEYASSADVAYDTALECGVTGGFGYIRVALDYARDDTFEQDIRIKRVADPLCVYGDPYSTAADSSDWNTAFYTDLLTKKQFKARFKDAECVDWESDFTDCQDWLEGDNVRVAEWWTREETVKQIVAVNLNPMMLPQDLIASMRGTAEPLPIFDLSVYEKNKDYFDAIGAQVVGSPRPVKGFKVRCRLMSGAEVLEETDWAGKYIPIVPVYGEEINLEGKRYFRSMIRSAKDAQRMFNYQRTMATELLALQPKAPFIGPKGAFDSDADKWSTANTETHGYLEYDGPVAPQRQQFSGAATGNLQEALNASDDMKSITGIYDASLGARSNETSGRAIIARQREGDVSTFAYIDNLSRGIAQVGRIIVDLIPHVYSAPRILRILGPDKKAVMVASAPAGQQPPNMPPKPGQAPQMPGQPPAPSEDDDGDDISGPDLARVYDLTTGTYDITVEAGPSYSTRRQEAAEQMMQFVQAMPNAAPIIGDLIASNLDWPGAKEIGKRLKQMLPPAAQGQDPQLMQAQQQIQMMQAQGAQMQQELQAAKTDNQVKVMDAQIKAKEAQTHAFAAETDRIKVLAEIEAKQYELMNPPEPEMPEGGEQGFPQ